MDHSEKMEFFKQAALGAPPAAVAGMTMLSVPLSEWVFIATLFYIGVQIAFLLYRWYRLIKIDLRKDKGQEAPPREDGE